MESIPTDPILEFPQNILESIRKQYNLDQPGRIEEAVDILCDWLKKQDHLVTKSYAREYLERILICCKGSVKKTKKKLDKLCTYRTVLPSYFEEFKIRENPTLKNITDAFLPKMTNDHYRVFLLRNWCKKKDFTLLDYYRCLILEGYATRVKAIHVITNSKLVDTLLAIIKKALSPKLAQRIHVHKKKESIYCFVHQNIMAEDYGGKEKSLQELNDRLIDEITSESFESYIKEMRKAITNEALRPSHGNAEYMGLPGSFRKLEVD